MTEPVAEPPLLPADDGEILGYNIILAASFMKALSDSRLRSEAKITMRQYIALRFLRSTPGAGSAELARNLFIAAQSAGPLLDNLEKLKYIDRAGGDMPGRKMAISLTDRGEAAVARGDRVIAALEEWHRSEMAPGDAAALNSLMQRLIRSLHGGRRP